MVGLLIHYNMFSFFFFFFFKRYSLAFIWIAWFNGKHLIENQLPFASEKEKKESQRELLWIIEVGLLQR